MIFEENVIDMLDEGERVEADSGYSKYDPRYVKSPANCILRSYDAAKLSNRARARQEIINKRMKQWGCMRKVFHHDLLKHQKCFNAVIVLTQFAIDEGENLFPIEYYNL